MRGAPGGQRRVSSGGRLRSPRCPPSRAPVSGTSRTSLCFTASCPQTLPARTLSQPPPHPTQCPGIAHEPPWTLPPKWTHGWAGWDPPHGLSARKGRPRGVSRSPPSLSQKGSTQRVHVLPLLQALSVFPFVCLCVCDSQGRMPPSWWGMRLRGTGQDMALVRWRGPEGQGAVDRELMGH